MNNVAKDISSVHLAIKVEGDNLSMKMEALGNISSELQRCLKDNKDDLDELKTKLTSSTDSVVLAVENSQVKLKDEINNLTTSYAKENSKELQPMKTEITNLAENVSVLLKNKFEIKNIQSENSDSIKEFTAYIANSCRVINETQLNQLEEQSRKENSENERLKSRIAELENAIKRYQLVDVAGINRDEIGHKTDFISKIVREIIAMNANFSLSSFLLHVPRVVCLLSFVCHKWLQDKDLPSICYVDKGITYFLTDTCRKCPHFFKTICETIDSISTEIVPILKRTENFTHLMLHENFSRIRESFPDIIIPISKVSSKIQDHVETIEKISNDMLLEIDKYIAEDVWMDKMTDIRRSFLEIATFFRSFGNRIRMIHTLSAEIQTNIKIKPSTDSSTNLLTDITCNQIGNLYTVVVVVNSVCECYLQMDRENLPKLVSILEKIISSPEEKVESFNYDMVINVTTENIKALVQKQKSALEENLNEVFRIHQNK